MEREGRGGRLERRREEEDWREEGGVNELKGLPGWSCGRMRMPVECLPEPDMPLSSDACLRGGVLWSWRGTAQCGSGVVAVNQGR